MPRQCGIGAVVSVGGAAGQRPLAGNLITVVKIVDGVENGVGVVDIHDGAVWEHALMLSMNRFHSWVPQKSSSMRNPPRSRYSRRACSLRVGELPIAHFARVHPGLVERIVAVVEIDGLFHGTGMDPAQAPESAGEMAIGAGVILRPAGTAFRQSKRCAVT